MLTNRILLAPFAAFAVLSHCALLAQDYRAPSGDVTFRALPAVLGSGLSLGIGEPAALYDYNGDGNLDVLWLSQGELVVLYGDGEGNFTPGTPTYLQPSFTPTGFFAVADMNGDGIPDFVACTYENEFYIALSNADGSFQAPVLIPTYFPSSANFSNYTINVVAADLNGDGKLDVIVAGEEGREVLLNTSVGNELSFQLSAQLITLEGGDVPDLAVADLNGDGKPDFVYSDENRCWSIWETATERSARLRP
jgi:hypothetical protein